MSKPKIYIDGEAGTTGLQIYQRLGQRDDIELLRIDPEKRKDTAERKRLLNEADISFLKEKQDEGADYIMTQLCWDMDQFRWWMDAIRAAGIWLPVDVGIMPVLDAAATINMALSRNGCVMPRELAEIISKHWIFPNPFAPNESEESIAAKKAAFKEAGMEYTIKLIDEYRVCGIDGIHLYALNKYEDVTRLVKESGIVDLI